LALQQQTCDLSLIILQGANVTSLCCMLVRSNKYMREKCDATEIIHSDNNEGLPPYLPMTQLATTPWSTLEEFLELKFSIKVFHDVKQWHTFVRN